MAFCYGFRSDLTTGISSDNAYVPTVGFVFLNDIKTCFCKQPYQAVMGKVKGMRFEKHIVRSTHAEGIGYLYV